MGCFVAGRLNGVTQRRREKGEGEEREAEGEVVTGNG